MYYIVLIVIKIVIIFYAQKNKNNEIKQIKIYRCCGIMLNLLTFVLSGIIVLVNKTGESFEYAEIMMLIVAIYTFWKIITAIIQTVKARKHDSINIQSIRNLNLVSALYSILVLQVEMFQAYGNTNNTIMNAITGAVIAVLILVISISMIIKSDKLLNNQNKSDDNNH